MTTFSLSDVWIKTIAAIKYLLANQRLSVIAP
jgi:hypothetical protein